MKRLVIDIEANGFKPDEIFCIGIHNLDTNEYKNYVLEDVPTGLLELLDADLVIGHYVKGYDLPVIKRLTNGLVDIPSDHVVDTLEFARELFPEMKSQGLETWGNILGYPKGKWTKFDKFYPGMVPYMDRDVEINVKLYEFLSTVKNENLR